MVFVWSQFGPYHMDRYEALAHALAGQRHVIGIEFVSDGEVYEWAPSGAGQAFQMQTLFAGKRISQVRRGGSWRRC